MWAGYFDEARGGSGPEGLARFNHDLTVDWGASPYRSAHSMLVKGADRALLGGWGPEYNVVTLVRISQDGARRVGTQCRIVLPDGIEAQRLRCACRGGDP